MNFSKSLALEFRENKIRVNSLMCNTIDTKLNRRLMPEENFDTWTKPKEIFDTMYIIMNEESKFINGEVIRLD